MPQIKDHTHSYIRVGYQTNRPSPNTYQCSDSDCGHFTYKKYLKGKRTLCPKCKSEEFLLKASDLRKAMPVCMNCSNTKEAKKLRETREALEVLGL